MDGFSKEDAFSDAKTRTLNSTRDQVLASVVGYSSKSITSSDLNPTMTNCEYVLLPVWMVNVKYNGAYYLFAMNGESGEFIGDIPLDKKKGFFIGFLTFIISFIFIIIASYILFRLGGN